MDKTINLMIESGLYQFFKSFDSFLEKIQVNTLFELENVQCVVHALTVDQLKSLFVAYLLLMGVCSIAFLSEIFIHYFKQRCSQRNGQIPIFHPKKLHSARIDREKHLN